MKKILIYLSAILSLSACGPLNTGEDKDIDPYKATNKEIFEFNQTLDKHLVKPLAELYDYLIPDFVENRILMFFSNLGEISVIGNDILQAKFSSAANDTTRFLINSSFGMFGLFDLATDNGFPKHKQSFAITLDYWGFKDSPYVVMPFLGSSTVYDSFSLPVDGMALSPVTYTKPQSSAVSFYAAEKVNMRSSLIPYDNIVLDSFDPYIMVRNAYLQKRTKEIAENAKMD